MSVNYAAELSPYENKGKCGLPEIIDDWECVVSKCRQLADMIRQSRHFVAHTGAGISTSAGIPDFRGPKGVWTLEKKGQPAPTTGVTFNTAKPTFTHRALTCLQASNSLQYLISQNVDGLHLRSGFPRSHLSELHGNMFMERCEKCRHEVVLDEQVGTIGQKYTGRMCAHRKQRGVCRGRMKDTVLDWEDSLPEKDLDLAYEHSKKADLSLCLGTTLQIVPAGNLPLLALKNPCGKLVICNLQPTKNDKKASLLIHYYVDDVMRVTMQLLGKAVPGVPGADLLLSKGDNEPNQCIKAETDGEGVAVSGASSLVPRLEARQLCAKVEDEMSSVGTVSAIKRSPQAVKDENNDVGSTAKRSMEEAVAV